MGVRRRPRSEARLDPETAEYFRRALETLEGGLNAEELTLFAPNVLLEAVSSMPEAALDAWGSRVLQALAPRAPLGMLGRLLAPLVLGGLGGPSGHPLGARVLEAALGRVPAALEEEEENGEGARKVVTEAVAQLAVAVRDDVVAFARHPAGSFVVRALLRVLGGVTEAGAPQLGAWPKDKGAGLPPSFQPLLDQLAQAFEDHLPSLQSPASASLCLQGALQALHHSRPSACAHLCDAVLSCAGGSLVLGLQDPERSRLLEAAMTVAEPGVLRQLFLQLKGNLRAVAEHRVANHGLQRLLERAPEDVIQEVLSELGPALSEPLVRGHPGVLTALMGACRRCPALQQEALRYLLQAFGCWEPSERRRSCLGPLATLRPFGNGDTEGTEPEAALAAVGLHGSLLLQHLLHFGDPGPILGALMALSPPALVALARSPPGSHVWDAILASPAVPARARRRLLRKLKGHFLSLARHRNGSRVLDAIWATAPGATRDAIARELGPQRQALLHDPHSRAIALALMGQKRPRASLED
ncbi:nucleolar protein 9 isoform X1 [Cuculus canorus]|uniref:nucleolar protein 9 isoform X1 n=1 Tax=Cuculus canorus TaxID=55661 RepID=UPI0023AA9412|nr:nucleolar protein 9 isoform X1 [Cuculus canorus]